MLLWGVWQRFVVYAFSCFAENGCCLVVRTDLVVQRMAAHAMAGSAAIAVAESAKQELARLRQQVAELQAEWRDFVRSQDVFWCAMEGIFFNFGPWS